MTARRRRAGTPVLRFHHFAPIRHGGSVATARPKIRAVAIALAGLTPGSQCR
ncbi:MULTISPECIES: hypothetical protein [Sphingomonadaceae]|uniref:hypothetical protein n=1 Tax=Sphingomonadales TaxID=204457 RepID=UPI0012BB2196|nr:MULTISPECIES: hypothetical protein [Sphingomonadaceae]QGP77795.1 hypothetical protein GL174_01370 [Sphingobium sp. CAP-1]